MDFFLDIVLSCVRARVCVCVCIWLVCVMERAVCDDVDVVKNLAVPMLSLRCETVPQIGSEASNQVVSKYVM